jgi:tetratricopeptide (TPR) repeat protein
MLAPEQRKAGKQIEAAIARDDWKRARTIIRAWLRRKPGDHWLLTRMSLTYYEQHNYGTALKYALQAVQSAPHCPLAVWDYAGALDMTGQREDALRAYRWLVKRGAENLAFGDCGEGIQSARSLVADCYYRMARIFEDQGQRKKAITSYQHHLAHRTRGTRSIYPLRDIRRKVRGLVSE